MSNYRAILQSESLKLKAEVSQLLFMLEPEVQQTIQSKSLFDFDEPTLLFTKQCDVTQINYSTFRNCIIW